MPVTAMSAKAGAGQDEPQKEDQGKKKKKKGRGRFIVVVAVVVACLVGAGAFLLRPSTPAEPEPGEVLALEPIQVNLAGGHYLRIGIALQLVAGAEEAEGSKALDATIELFSGRSMDQLALPEQRDKVKATLLERLEAIYHGDVMEVYFTDFVTQ